MSIKSKYLIRLLVLLSQISFSQNSEKDTLFLFLDLNSKTIKHSIKKDTNSATFIIYRKGFETEKSRDSLKRLYSYRGKNVPKNTEEARKIDPKDLPNQGIRPQFFFNYYNIKLPKRVKSISGIDYISELEFRDNELSYIFIPTIFIIHKIINDEFLIWEVDSVTYE